MEWPGLVEGDKLRWFTFHGNFFVCVGNLATVYPKLYQSVGKGVKLKCSITDISFELLHNTVYRFWLFTLPNFTEATPWECCQWAPLGVLQVCGQWSVCYAQWDVLQCQTNPGSLLLYLYCKLNLNLTYTKLHVFDFLTLFPGLACC